MKHARPDYDPIQDPRGLIPEDEPVFLLRAQDEIAKVVISVYAALAQAKGLPQIAQTTRDQADRFARWPVSKLPDLPEPEEKGFQGPMSRSEAAAARPAEADGDADQDATTQPGAPAQE